jgi:small subunit ribosomal protein S4
MGRRPSEYGTQLREKQKTRRIYGIMERQFRKYFETARIDRGATGEILLRLLETRLDNVVYRLGLASTRSQARQLVGHGHVLVNGKGVTVPSYKVQPGETISLDAKTVLIDSVKSRLETPPANLPAWLKRKAIIGTIVALPKREDIDTVVNEQLIVEYYSNR